MFINKLIIEKYVYHNVIFIKMVNEQKDSWKDIRRFANADITVEWDCRRDAPPANIFFNYLNILQIYYFYSP